MNLLLNKAHYPVTTLGPGRRIGIWFQGCSIACRGCVSRDTWPADSGTRIGVGELIQWCRSVAGNDLDGVTISGGEPFEQPAALQALTQGLNAWRDSAQLDFDILCYSGFALNTLKSEYGSILGSMDAVIPEPYVARLPQSLWRGSSNQTLTVLSPRGERVYAAYIDTTAASQPRLQVEVTDGEIWLVGIPAPGSMPNLEVALHEQGIELGDVSWRP